MDIAGITGFTAFACIFAFTAAGMVWDIKYRKLPNKLTVTAFVLGLLFQTFLGEGFLFGVKGFAVGFGIVFVLFAVGGSGGGDVKFMGALGAWLGAWLTFQVLVVSAILSAAITLVVLGGKVFRLKRLDGGNSANETKPSEKKKKTRSSEAHSWRSKESRKVPYGVPAALATWILLAIQWAGYGLPWPPIHH
jgi:prepilin peptidase CpaA